MDEYVLSCPCCNQKIKVYISENGNCAIGYYDTLNQSETLKIARKLGYEFGQALDNKGGEQEGEN